MFRYYYYILFLFFYINEIHAKAKETKITFNNIDNLNSIVNDNQVDTDELRLNFVEDHYGMANLPISSIDITVISNVTFIGSVNGTVFDYSNGKKGNFQLGFNKVGKSVKFENIIFKNYNLIGQYNVYMIKINS